MPRPSRRAAPPPAKSQASPAPEATLPAWFQPVTLALAGFALLCCFSAPFQSNDGWWHLELGKYILEHRRLPVPDPFNFATYLKGPAYPGEDVVRHFNLTHEWLSEVFFYAVWRVGGYGAVVLFRALILMAACGAMGLMVWRRTAQQPGRAYLAVLAALAPASVLYLFATDRPHIFTILFAALFLLILDAGRPLWLLPPIALIWANCHGGFIMSWILAGTFCITALYQRVRSKPLPGEGRLYLWSAAAVVVSLANPNGWNAIATIVYYRHSRMLSVIAEWRRTVLWPPGGFVVLLVAGALVLLWARRRARAIDLLLFTLFGVAGIYAVRNIVFIGLFAPVAIASYVSWKGRLAPQTAGFAAAALTLAVAITPIAQGKALDFHAVESTRPAGAANFLEQHHITGRIYNNLEHGGYLMWHLWPRNQVFSDGRLLNETVYGDYRLLTYNIDAGKPPLEILDDYGVQAVVLTGFEYVAGGPHMMMLALANPAQTTWKLVYKDGVAAVFMRRPPAGVDALPNGAALTAMQEQCAEHIRQVPSEPGCARGMAQIFQRLNDIPDARRWMAFYLERKVGPDPEAERQYQMMVAGGR